MLLGRCFDCVLVCRADQVAYSPALERLEQLQFHSRCAVASPRLCHSKIMLDVPAVQIVRSYLYLRIIITESLDIAVFGPEALCASRIESAERPESRFFARRDE